MRTEQGLVDGMWTGLALCGPAAFLVLCAATNNVILALYAALGRARANTPGLTDTTLRCLPGSYAVVCIAGIVASVLGAGENYFGWSLGIAESISAVIVIGFSVDCTLRPACMCSSSSHDVHFSPPCRRGAPGAHVR